LLLLLLLQLTLVLSCFSHFLYRLGSYSHGLHACRHATVDHTLQNHLPDLDLRDTIPDRSFGVQRELRVAFECCEEREIYPDVDSETIGSEKLEGSGTPARYTASIWRGNEKYVGTY
jgi:hypothetical protein